MRYKQLTGLFAAGFLAISCVGAIPASDAETVESSTVEPSTAEPVAAEPSMLEQNEPAPEVQPAAVPEEQGEDYLEDQETPESVNAQLEEAGNTDDGTSGDTSGPSGGASGASLGDVKGLIEDTGVVSVSREGESLEELLEKELEEENLNGKVQIPGFFVDPTKYPSANITVNSKLVYRFLRKDMKLNHAAACGVLANIQLESNFRPIALGDGGTSYGICQWHLGRFVHLMSFCKKEGLDYNTLYGQLCYLKYELETCYPGVLAYLENTEDTEEGSYLAGYNFCYHFEIPDFTEERSERRGNLGKNEYFVKEKKEYRLTKEERKDLKEAYEDGISDDLLVISRDLRKNQELDVLPSEDEDVTESFDEEDPDEVSGEDEQMTELSETADSQVTGTPEAADDADAAESIPAAPGEDSSKVYDMRNSVQEIK